MLQENTDQEKLFNKEERPMSTKKKEKKEKKERVEQDRRDRIRKKRRLQKQELLEKVPTINDEGIKYTKLQIKRMVKRVKRGLHPVPTIEEERERLRNEAKMRREDESEFAGLVYQREEDGSDVEAGTEKESDRLYEDDTEDATDASQGKEVESLKGFTKDVTVGEVGLKKAKRSKPVPHDYICQACNNKIKPAHWIYDCSMKITVKGRNQKKKKLRGIHEPDSKKLFVSGLPFDVKPADVTSLFRGCGKVVNCKLIKFGDTGRCNGQAYVSFDTDEAASQALKLSGTMIDNGSDDTTKKKGGKSSEAGKRKQLKLKVSKVVNRRASGTIIN